jgi:hypothetical protein
MKSLVETLITILVLLVIFGLLAYPVYIALKNIRKK